MIKIQEPLFSIIVPIYKVEQYLERCMDPLFNQTEKNIEIILVDDGSPDNCPQMCDEYAKKDNRVVVVHKKNGGLSDARNEGIKRATGKYIILVDSDDYIDKNFCKKITSFAKKNVDIIAIDGIAEGGVVNLKHAGVENKKIYNGKEFLKNTIKNGSISMAAWLYVYKREFLLTQNLEFKKGILHEDEQFTPRAILSAESVINTGFAFYHYVIRENSIMTKRDKRRNARDLYETCEQLCSIYDGLEDSELKSILKDALVNKYLSLFQDGRLYKYGKEYLHKDFIAANAYKKRTKRKAFLYILSPRIYWHLNSFLKTRS